MNNRLGNSKNPYQGKRKKVLCICSAGLLRSPTAAFVLSQEPFGFNTRAAGIVEEYALVHADSVLIYWADAIVVMDKTQERYIVSEIERMDESMLVDSIEKPVHVLDVPDNFGFRNEDLVEMMKGKLGEIFND